MDNYAAAMPDELLIGHKPCSAFVAVFEILFSHHSQHQLNGAFSWTDDPSDMLEFLLCCLLCRYL